MREAVRLELPGFGAPVDYVIHPRRSVAGIPLTELRREVVRIFNRCEKSS